MYAQLSPHLYAQTAVGYSKHIDKQFFEIENKIKL